MPLTEEQAERLRDVLTRREEARAGDRSGQQLLRSPEKVRVLVDVPPTAREIEVLRLAADGDTNLEIAQAMGLSEETVKCYIKRLLVKLPAKNRAGAVAVGLRSGLIE